MRDLDPLDMIGAELHEVLATIGPPAIPHLEAFIFADRDDPMAVCTAIEGLARVGVRHPPWRTECISILTRMLGRGEPIDDTVNGSAVAGLLDLKAVEALDEIRDAFRRDVVDISIAGDLEDVEIDLGVRSQRTTPRPHYFEWQAAEESEGETLLKSLAAPMAPAKRSKVGRNDPCPCGSGRKFKKCCGDSSKQTAAPLRA